MKNNPSNPAGLTVTRWAINHPIGTIMIALAAIVVGLFSLQKLNIDLLPHIIYPDVRIRVLNEGVPPSIMEDEITRQLEEQLAITEDVIHIESTTTEGRSAVNLSFSYQKDIDIALRDASTRLDRAKRFLPDEIDPPVIYKRDPFQLPISEYIISSKIKTPAELRDFTDYQLRPLLLTIPGVAAAEVGGGSLREIQIIVDQDRLASFNLDVLTIENLLLQENTDTSAGQLIMTTTEFSGRTQGRFKNINEIRQLPIPIANEDGTNSYIPLSDIAHIIDGSEEEKLKIKFNDLPGIKLSIQKQPQANTVNVVNAVKEKLRTLKLNKQLPDDISINQISNQAKFIENSLSNATQAALSGAVLAMLVVYLFLGNLKRTLVIGSVIPIAILMTFIIMSITELTLNIMTLGGLALGIGLLVDNTIVMLENVYRHQKMGKDNIQSAQDAASEVSSPIFAATSTNLAAVLPFLFIGGLTGLLFKELILTISAAIIGSLVVALTLTPALAAKITDLKDGRLRQLSIKCFSAFPRGYKNLLKHLLSARWLVIAIFIAGLGYAVSYLQTFKQSFLPAMDEGVVSIRLIADKGTTLESMNHISLKIEETLQQIPGVIDTHAMVGGFIFGRSQYESSNKANLKIFLEPGTDSEKWVKLARKQTQKLAIPGLKVNIKVQGIRGIRLNQGEDDVSLKIQGNDLDTLITHADKIVDKLATVEGLSNIQHSNQEVAQEISVTVDRQRASSYGITAEAVGKAVRLAINGSKVSDFISNDRAIDIRLKLNQAEINTPSEIGNIILFSNLNPRQAIRVHDVARINIVPTPSSIKRDKQQRIVEITASLSSDTGQQQVIEKALQTAKSVTLPQGYNIYEAGSLETLKTGKDMSLILLGLAIFLVFVVMSVQYESIRNPLIILASIPFSLIGVTLGLFYSELPFSMPVWLGLIMLSGITVNNAIVLVDYIEQKRSLGMQKHEAILEAASIRLRPILMTTITTVIGMTPLALGLGEGAEMLQPLAVTIISGLLFALFVSLVLIPVVYFQLSYSDNHKKSEPLPVKP